MTREEMIREARKYVQRGKEVPRISERTETGLAATYALAAIDLVLDAMEKKDEVIPAHGPVIPADGPPVFVDASRALALANAVRDFLHDGESPFGHVWMWPAERKAALAAALAVFDAGGKS